VRPRHATNTARARLARGESVLCAWITTFNPVAAEAIAHAGFDAVAIDTQHGAVDAGELLTLLQAMSATDATPFVRVAWNDPALVMKALDLGAWGVICPMIEGVDDVRRFVAACRYPPAGIRSYGPTRGRFLAGPGYADVANAEVLALAMLETSAALEALDELLAVPGLDGVFVGPADLSLALGGPSGTDWDEGPVAEALEGIVSACTRAGKVAGIYTKSVPYARRMRELGFRLLVVGGDIDHLAMGMRTTLDGMRAPRDA
jgi:4-hydroxy-2-oxoheptanedioate aldolase